MMRRFPYPPYETDSFDVEGVFVKLLRLAFLFYIVNIVKDVIKDKEEKMKVCIRLLLLLYLLNNPILHTLNTGQHYKTVIFLYVLSCLNIFFYINT